MKSRRMIKVQHTKLENTWWLAKRVVALPSPPLNDIHKDDKSSTLGKLENTWWLAKRVVALPSPPLNDIHKDDKSSTLANWKTHGG
jgi:hypothetical protein